LGATELKVAKALTTYLNDIRACPLFLVAGSLAGLPPPAPTDPDVPLEGIRFVNGQLGSAAVTTPSEAGRAPLRLSRGVPVTGNGAAKCSPWFPPRALTVGSALPSTGSSEASSPASPVLRHCATPWAPDAGLGCLRPALPCGAPVVSLPSVQDAQPRAWGSRAGPHCQQKKNTQGGRQGLPSSRETPIASVPCSSTPVGLHAPRPVGAAARPPLEERRRLPH
jgi:hypothetical protein